MAATRDQIYAAIKAADAAGDTDSVQKLGTYLKTMPADASQADKDRALYSPVLKGDGSFLGNAGANVENFAAGAGKAVSDLGSGFHQLYAKAADAISPQAPTMSGLVTGQQPTRAAGVQADIDEAKRLDAPLMNTGAGIAGNLAGNVAMTVLPGSVVAKGAQGLGMARTALAARAFVNPATYAGAAGAGATVGALQPVATGDPDHLMNAGLGAVGGVVGQGVVNGIGRLVQPIKNALDPIRQKAIDTLQSAGVPLDLAQVTGSPTLNRIRSVLNDNPFTAGAQASLAGRQREAFTTAVSNLMGENAPALTSDVMGGVRDRTNGVIGDVLNRTNVQPRPAWVDKATSAQAGAIENQKTPVVSMVNRLFDAIDPQTGTIPGQVAYGIKKDLDRIANTQDTTQNYLVRQVRSALLDGVNGSLSRADQSAFASARGQQAIMHKVEGAIPTDGSGELSVNKLANILGQKANRSASIYGNGPQDLVNLAQSGKQVLGDNMPNSGTAARAAMMLAPGAIVGVGTGLYTDDWEKAAKYGIGAFGAPKLAQFVMNNPTAVRVLSQGVTSPAARAFLQLPENNLLANLLARNLPGIAARNRLLQLTQQNAAQP